MTKNIFAIDFGAGSSLAICGPDGPIKVRLPRIAGGKTQRQELYMKIDYIFRELEGDVVMESATIGSSGCEPKDMEVLLEKYPDRAIYTVTTRLLKNWRKDYDIEAKKPNDHDADAALIYDIVQKQPYRMKQWLGKPIAIDRVNTSVRPMDKRGYRDERAEEYMSRLPAFEDLPDNLKQTFGDGSGKKYLRARVIPFVMALDEPALQDPEFGKNPRRRYEKIVGLYESGYPSFYRRDTVDVMQRIAKGMAGTTKMDEVDRGTRKEAWRQTQRDVRNLFHLIYKEE